MNNQGHSAAHFYLSADRMYVIKTLTTEEVEEMHSLLKQYHPYIVDRHAKTLLPQYLAMFRLTVDNIETYLVVIRNVFSAHLKVHGFCRMTPVCNLVLEFRCTKSTT